MTSLQKSQWEQMSISRMELGAPKISELLLLYLISTISDFNYCSLGTSLNLFQSPAIFHIRFSQNREFRLTYGLCVYRKRLLIWGGQLVLFKWESTFQYNIIFETYQSLEPLAPFLGETDVCHHRLFFMKFYDEAFLM